ncbi:MAG: Gfo/Idh/MocA family oxidoreductase [Clostridia bacterium]|nr:Gfo/Idh/MocA family oxidoreductase [Clostridia bacterium]
MKTAFAGFRHDHIFVLYDQMKKHKDFEIAGAFENDAGSRKAAGNKGVGGWYPSYEALLSDKSVEAVALGGVYGERGEMAVKALEAGKNVIADKPLCTSLAELEKIERLAAEKNLAVSCMFTLRFETKINSVKSLIDGGALGDIQNIYIGGQHPLRYGRRPAWYFDGKSYGGVINDLGIHGVDLVYYFGLKPGRVLAAREWNAYADKEKNFLDSAQFMLECEGGAGVISDVSYSIPDGVEFGLPYYWQFYIWGKSGVISFSLNEKETKYYIKGDPAPRILAQKAPETDYLSDFLKAVRGDKDAVLTTEDVLRSSKTALAIRAEALR